MKLVEGPPQMLQVSGHSAFSVGLCCTALRIVHLSVFMSVCQCSVRSAWMLITVLLYVDFGKILQVCE